VRIARRQRSETCFLVAKEMIALEQWFTERPSEVGEVTGNDIQDERDGEVKQTQTESAQAKWLRGVCREVRVSCINSNMAMTMLSRRHSNAGERN
jgi:hypothetical protein